MVVPSKMPGNGDHTVSLGYQKSRNGRFLALRSLSVVSHVVAAAGAGVGGGAAATYCCCWACFCSAFLTHHHPSPSSFSPFVSYPLFVVPSLLPPGVISCSSGGHPHVTG